MENRAYTLSDPRHTHLSVLAPVYPEPLPDLITTRCTSVLPSSPLQTRVTSPPSTAGQSARYGGGFQVSPRLAHTQPPCPKLSQHQVGTPARETGGVDSRFIPSDFWSAAKPRACAPKFTGKEPHAKVFFHHIQSFLPMAPRTRPPHTARRIVQSALNQQTSVEL